MSSRLFYAGALLFAFAACARETAVVDERPVGLVLASATRIGQMDTRLGAALCPRNTSAEGWAADEKGFHSPSRSGGADAHGPELGVTLPTFADDEAVLELGKGPSMRLALRPEGAAHARGALASGHVVYPGAYGGAVDRLVTISPTSVEELLLLRDATAKRDYRWHLDLPSGIARVVRGTGGELSFENVAGRALLRSPAAYAMDARGVKRAAQLTWSAEQKALDVHLDTEGLEFPVLLDPAFETVTWTLANSPQPVVGSRVAEDAANGTVIRFGGVDGAGNDTSTTWAWNGSDWSPLAPSVSPSPRHDAAMAYDAAHGRIVLFGGADSSGPRSDTWSWDGVSWTDVTPAVATMSPSARTFAASAYDAARHRIVLFGGRLGDGTVGNDTWTWDGSSWTEATTNPAPSARAATTMVYDAARSDVLLFGGADANGNDYGDTWTWNGASWSKLAPAKSPTARDNAATFFDTATQTVVLYGGESAGALLGETWSWNGASWTRASPATSPPAGANGTAAFHSSSQRGVLYQAVDDTTTAPATWTWDGTTWTGRSANVAPSERILFKTVYETSRNDVMLFGGRDLYSVRNAETWRWNGELWAELSPATSPPADDDFGMAYDARNDKVVVFGGVINGNATWLWNGTTWAQAHPANSPSARTDPAMVYDGATQRVLLFGGYDGTKPLGDTWNWDGSNWAQVSPAASPPARYESTIAFDSTRGNVVLFAGQTANAAFTNDTWLWNGVTWSSPTLAVVPVPRHYAQMSDDPSGGRVVLFGGYNGVDVLGDTWLWNGTSWTGVLPTTSPPGREYAGLSPAAGGGLLLWGGAIHGALDNATWTFTVGGQSCVTGSQCDSGFCTDGVCCATASCGACQACNGGAPGTCSPVTNAPDPDSCSGASSCSASGVCLAVPGQMCTSASGCASGHCVDGVCCDTACTGLCQACSAATKTSGSDGTCGLAASGFDPHNDCAAIGTCGKDGTCDGNGECRFTLAGVPCGSGTCDDNRASGQICDGRGLCVESANGVDCAPFVCNVSTGGCMASCTDDDGCTLGNHCDQGVCRSRAAYGDACQTASACPEGGSCVDGVCCNSACSGQCESCTEPGAKGTCVPVFGAPRLGRPACAAAASDDVCSVPQCDGVTGGSCAGFTGPSVACGAASCVEGVASTIGHCSGKGDCEARPTPCSPYGCRGDVCGSACTSDGDCNAQFHCDLSSGSCVTRAVAVCDGAHTLTAPNGDTTDCAPYVCSGALCETRCRSIRDCVAGFVCGAGGTCVVSPATDLASGCSVTPGDEAGDDAWAWLLVGSFGLVVRGTRRRSQRGGARS